MRRPIATFVIVIAAAASVAAQQTRIASDFEIAQMRNQIARSAGFLAQLSGHLNLGDAYRSRNEPAIARAEYSMALEIADAERMKARRESDLTRYATATSYAALAHAKLGNPKAFDLAEESIRYSAGSADTWNLYASAMTLLRKPAKAVSAARNAVSIASTGLDTSRDQSARLDLAVYEYALASALIETGSTAEAEDLLRRTTEALRSTVFASLRRGAAHRESFEIYSTASGDEAAYLSILNRAQLRLGALLEKRGDIPGAKIQYGRVLETRTDDPTALTALARLGGGGTRELHYAAAFEANPFALPLIRDYQRYIAHSTPVTIEGTSIGARLRRTLVHVARGETHAARTSLDALIAAFPNNETLRTLRQEITVADSSLAFLNAAARAPTGDELRQLAHLLATGRLSAEQRLALDKATFTSTVTFAAAQPGSGQTVFESGNIEGLPFRFGAPTAFSGTFAPNTPLRLTYLILGATAVNGTDALLLEPVRLEAAP